MDAAVASCLCLLNKVQPRSNSSDRPEASFGSFSEHVRLAHHPFLTTNFEGIYATRRRASIPKHTQPLSCFFYPTSLDLLKEFTRNIMCGHEVGYGSGNLRRFDHDISARPNPSRKAGLVTCMFAMTRLCMNVEIRVRGTHLAEQISIAEHNDVSTNFTPFVATPCFHLRVHNTIGPHAGHARRSLRLHMNL